MTYAADTRTVGSPARGRWLVLATFSLLVACTQLLWLTLAPVTVAAGRDLGVSTGAIGDLAVLNPLLFVLLAIPAGRWMDRRCGPALAAGAVFTALGALVRTVDTSSYGWVLAGQVLFSVGQPLVLTATTKVPVRWFPAAERTTAIAVGSAAQFVGILVAALTGTLLYDRGGLGLLLGTHAVVSTLAAVAVLVALRVPALTPDGPVAEAAAGRLPRWREDRVLWLLAGVLVIGFGTFNALATWLDAILTKLGLPGDAGPLIAVTTVAGILGAAVVPPWVARHDRRRPVVLATVLTTVAVFALVAGVHQVVVVGAALAVEGFLLLSGLPVALEWAEQVAGPDRAAWSAGFLMLAGNLGGVVYVLVVQAAVGNAYAALGVMSLAALPGLWLALRLPKSVTVAPAVTR